MLLLTFFIRIIKVSTTDLKQARGALINQFDTIEKTGEDILIQKMTGAKSWYYNEAFKKLSSRWISLNWSAASLGFFWFVYRKMYKEFFIITVASLALSLPLSYFNMVVGPDMFQQ
ncbi:hypothetical protein AGMMS49949_08470 [Alphaproteobacteria bacterium]|nr:hypothetical protein AGMMS49949_08470 [Alphaproteobacteria bacterium]GHS99522.1 hypothetical protein AGMMS50296_7690 [Alphaproteobacteria bacterium]